VAVEPWTLRVEPLMLLLQALARDSYEKPTVPVERGGVLPDAGTFRRGEGWVHHGFGDKRLGHSQAGHNNSDGGMQRPGGSAMRLSHMWEAWEAVNDCHRGLDCAVTGL
jgi:hypothetical protein